MKKGDRIKIIYKGDYKGCLGWIYNVKNHDEYVYVKIDIDIYTKVKKINKDRILLIDKKIL